MSSGTRKTKVQRSSDHGETSAREEGPDSHVHSGRAPALWGSVCRCLLKCGDDHVSKAGQAGAKDCD